ncbi:MAG: hypothetical protein WCH65_04595, partial [bacterium]
MYIKKTLVKVLNAIIITIIFFLFILDIFTIYFLQSRISILDINQFINPSLGNFLGMIISIVFLICVICIAIFFLVQSKHYKKNKRLLLSLYL